jgi:hypothetical protein
MMRSLLHVALQALARCQFNSPTKKKKNKRKILKIRENKMASFGASLAPCWRLHVHLAPSHPFGTLTAPSVF